MTECQGIAGRLFGHRFEGKYNEGKPTFEFESVKSGSADAVARIITASKPITYVCSVCTRCGAASMAPQEKAE